MNFEDWWEEETMHYTYHQKEAMVVTGRKAIAIRAFTAGAKSVVTSPPPTYAQGQEEMSERAAKEADKLSVAGRCMRGGVVSEAIAEQIRALQTQPEKDEVEKCKWKPIFMEGFYVTSCRGKRHVWSMRPPTQVGVCPYCHKPIRALPIKEGG